MGIYDMLTGKGTLSDSNKYVAEFLSQDEELIANFTFIRDSIALTNKGIYFVDVQGTGKKVKIKFFPAKNVKSISFETAGSLDLDVDIKIGVDGNTEISPSGMPFNAPISFKVPKNQSDAAKNVFNIIKELYLYK